VIKADQSVDPHSYLKFEGLFLMLDESELELIGEALDQPGGLSNPQVIAKKLYQHIINTPKPKPQTNKKCEKEREQLLIDIANARIEIESINAALQALQIAYDDVVLDYDAAMLTIGAISLFCYDAIKNCDDFVIGQNTKDFARSVMGFLAV
jgi:hypothetical protein